MTSKSADSLLETALTQANILEMAASVKGLTLYKSAKPPCSEPIKEYVLDEALLKALAKRGIRQEDRPDEVFTLVDMNPQKRESAGWKTTNYWNFKQRPGSGGEYDLTVQTSAVLYMRPMSHFVHFVPRVFSSLTWATDPDSNLRMFRVLVKSDKDAPDFARELATSRKSVVVAWAELGLGDIRSLYSLFFFEISKGNREIERLIREDVFSPNPQSGGGDIFVPQQAQAEIVDVWKAQLETHGNRSICA